MPKRVSYSLLDPWLTQPLKGLYSWLKIPARFPPEGIVALGHISAIAGAIGFACAAHWWWGGLLAALGVVLNHTCDVLDGTHARATDQCRNGGELLDHFVDPLSFSYWVAGLAYSADCLLLGIGGVIVIYATAVLTNIKAKMVGEFTLARFGPTEFKTLLILFGLLMTGTTSGWWFTVEQAPRFAFWFVTLMFIAGLVQLKLSLWRAIREVNTAGAAPDTTEWEIED
ncbi:MAG: CDP-alcohol phosphatidyltransferase family protein [Pirellulales bacterium]|nr:CDP-alcohol phosphatidyltransferase family protein [Pirellulales bacterium]